MESKQNRRILLIAAGGLLLVALLWSIRLNVTGEGAKLCRKLNAFGYTLHPDDIYPAGSWNDTSIRALLPQEGLVEAVAASKAAGFSSDIDREGQVTLLMASIGSREVITLYLLDGEIELGFIQAEGSEVVRALTATE